MCIVKFENVSKKYPYEKDFLLQEISFDVKAGERVGIVAEKQCGKSTIVKMLADLAMPSGGDIFYNGRPLGETEINERNIGVIFEDFALMKGKSVLKNIEFPLKVRNIQDFHEKALSAAENFGLTEVIDVKVKKLDEETKFRTALARLSTRNICLLVLDDVYRNIGASKAIEYTERFLKTQNCAVLSLSSTTGGLIGCGKVYVVADGKTVFNGSLAEAGHHILDSKCFDKIGINVDMEKMAAENITEFRK